MYQILEKVIPRSFQQSRFGDIWCNWKRTENQNDDSRARDLEAERLLPCQSMPLPAKQNQVCSVVTKAIVYNVQQLIEGGSIHKQKWVCLVLQQY